VVSEKSYGLLDEGKYTFLVDPRANKTEIKIAVEQVFGVKVSSVNTSTARGRSAAPASASASARTPSALS
jgi:large subunit ribosomal protein L23